MEPMRFSILCTPTDSSDKIQLMCSTRGGARHFHLGGPLEEPVLQQGELSMV